MMAWDDDSSEPETPSDDGGGDSRTDVPPVLIPVSSPWGIKVLKFLATQFDVDTSADGWQENLNAAIDEVYAGDAPEDAKTSLMTMAGEFANDEAPKDLDASDAFFQSYIDRSNAWLRKLWLQHEIEDATIAYYRLISEDKQRLRDRRDHTGWDEAMMASLIVKDISGLGLELIELIEGGWVKYGGKKVIDGVVDPITDGLFGKPRTDVIEKSHKILKEENPTAPSAGFWGDRVIRQLERRIETWLGKKLPSCPYESALDFARVMAAIDGDIRVAQRTIQEHQKKRAAIEKSIRDAVANRDSWIKAQDLGALSFTGIATGNGEIQGGMSEVERWLVWALQTRRGGEKCTTHEFSNDRVE
jgi:hypothetical protein